MLYHAGVFALLAPLLFSLPIWVVLLFGIVFGVLTLGHHRRVSQLAIVSLGGFLVLDLMGTVVWTAYEWLVGAPGQEGMPVFVTSAFFVLQTVIHALFIGVGVAAALRGRRDHAGE